MPTLAMHLSTVQNPQFKFVGPGCSEQLLAWLLGPRPPANWRHLYSRGDVVVEVVAVGISALGRPKGALAYLKGNKGLASHVSLSRGLRRIF